MIKSPLELIEKTGADIEKHPLFLNRHKVKDLREYVLMNDETDSSLFVDIILTFGFLLNGYAMQERNGDLIGDEGNVDFDHLSRLLGLGDENSSFMAEKALKALEEIGYISYSMENSTLKFRILEKGLDLELYTA